MESINEIVSNLDSFELSHCPEVTLSTYTSCSSWLCSGLSGVGGVKEIITIDNKHYRVLCHAIISKYDNEFIIAQLYI